MEGDKTEVAALQIDLVEDKEGELDEHKVAETLVNDAPTVSTSMNNGILTNWVTVASHTNLNNHWGHL